MIPRSLGYERKDKNAMNREELKQILPHREPMLLLDEAELTPDGEAIGRYHVNGDEFFLQGHFPDMPVMPGVIQLEIMAQTCCALMKDEVKGKNTLYTGINNAKFKGMVRPGDTLETHCKIVKARPPFYFAEGKGFVDGKLCVKAELSFALTPKE